MLRQWISLACACAALLIVAADAGPPRIPEPAAPQANYVVSSSGLVIQPGRDETSLRFGPDVVATGADFELCCGELEVLLGSIGLDTVGELSVPPPAAAPEEIARDPAATAQEMARGITLPSPGLSRANIRLMRASGSVRINAEGTQLSAAAISSSDGGLNWTAGGRCSLRREDADGGVYSMAADSLSYNTVARTAAASGGITAELLRPGEEKLSISAGALSADLDRRLLLASGGLSAQFGALQLTCETLDADLAGNRVSARGKAGRDCTFSDPGEGLSVSAPRLDYQLKSGGVSLSGGVKLTQQQGAVLHADRVEGNLSAGKRRLTATGGISVEYGASGIALTAQQLSADLDARTLEATGNPRAQQGVNTFTGERILVTQTLAEGGWQTSIEVFGEQEARIDPESLPGTNSGTGSAADEGAESALL